MLPHSWEANSSRKIIRRTRSQEDLYFKNRHHLLLDAGADPNAANDFAATPLMWCTGDAVKVRLLLSKGARVNVRSKLGRTPLLVAAAYDGATEAARLLIEKGADVNARDESGMSVLEQAASSNHIELVRLLLAKGADVNTADLGAAPR